MGRNIVSHDFYCINCGKRGIPLPRQRGHQHSTFHRKKLYCIYCQKEVNMVECKTEYDVQEFLEDFNNGVFVKEAEESLTYCQGGK